jgi:uncharacterized protein
MTKPQILNTIKSVAQQTFPDCKVILFGSRARDDYDEDSDYDILVIIEKTMAPTDKMPFKTIIRKELLKYRIFSDILIQSEKEIEIKKQLTGHIIRTIMREGLPL